MSPYILLAVLMNVAVHFTYSFNEHTKNFKDTLVSVVLDSDIFIILVIFY